MRRLLAQLHRRRQDGAPRAPTMRYLVRLTVRCTDAEELGRKLRRRYQRQAKRQGIATGRSPQAETELAERLDRLLDPVE